MYKCKCHRAANHTGKYAGYARVQAFDFTILVTINQSIRYFI